jgi:endonuclease YncB( thermonuclease family)
VPEQPFSKEAKAWLERTVLGRRVDIVPYKIDQYQRLIGAVYVQKYFLWKSNVSVDMVKSGFGVVYRQSGSEYGSFKDELEQAETAARLKRKGLWSQGAQLVLPSQHKAKYLGN